MVYDIALMPDNSFDLPIDPTPGVVALEIFILESNCDGVYGM